MERSSLTFSADAATWSTADPIDLKRSSGPGHPLYVAMLREAIFAILGSVGIAVNQGHSRTIAIRFRAFQRSGMCSCYCFQDYHLRRQVGENATPADYERRFGVDVTTRPRPRETVVCGDPAGATCSPTCPKETDARPESDAVAAFGTFRSDLASRSSAGRTTSTGNFVLERLRAKARPFRRPRRAANFRAGSARPPAAAITAMPRVGGDSSAFACSPSWAAGTFGRVYLARQGELADRLVVLKIAPQLFGESRTLAQLQHTHIVPIYSVHQADDFQAICMPFLGTTTLADVLTDLRKRPALPDSGKYLLDRIEAAGTSAGDRRGDLHARSPASPGPPTPAPPWRA